MAFISAATVVTRASAVGSLIRGRCLIARSNTARARPRLLPAYRASYQLLSSRASTFRPCRNCGHRHGWGLSVSSWTATSSGFGSLRMARADVSRQTRTSIDGAWQGSEAAQLIFLRNPLMIFIGTPDRVLKCPL